MVKSKFLRKCWKTVKFCHTCKTMHFMLFFGHFLKKEYRTLFFGSRLNFRHPTTQGGVLDNLFYTFQWGWETQKMLALQEVWILKKDFCKYSWNFNLPPTSTQVALIEFPFLAIFEHPKEHPYWLSLIKIAKYSGFRLC